MLKSNVERYWEELEVVAVEPVVKLVVVDPDIVGNWWGSKAVAAVLYRMRDSADSDLFRSPIICAIVVMGAQSGGTIK